ncbi:extracellular solute-binding protein [Microbacterium sp. NPDC056044]|uniref:extracellular solute-binding protein n=1 Tax=Microbacterium sp. NPDC056044 TaxID=3345690 RepID=UPI0035D82AFE
MKNNSSAIGRKVLVGVAAATLVGALAGCSQGGSGGGLSTGGAEGGKGGETLVVMAGQGPWHPGYAAAIAEYEKESGNKVDVRQFPNNDLVGQMVNDIQGGKHVFDVYLINESDMTNFVDHEWLRPFTDIDPDYQLDPEIFTYDSLPYWDAETKTFTPDGTLTSAPINGNLQILSYRTDIYDDLGLDTPETWQDVVDNGKEIQQEGAAKYGGAYALQGATGGYALISYYFQPILNALGGTWFADEGTDWTPTVDSPQAIDAAKLFRELALTGPEATTTMGQAQALAAVQAGDAAQSYLVPAAALQLEDEANSNVVGKITYAPLPDGPDGEPATSSGIWSLGVPAGLDDDRSETALDFIDYVTSKDAQTVFTDNGGIPIRGDVDLSALDDAKQEALKANSDSAKGATGQFRYLFAADMLTITEPILTNIAAGTVTPEAGMADMQAQLTALIKKQGLPMN